MSRDSFHVTARWDSREVKAALAALAPRQWAFAQSLALNRVAAAVESDERDTMRRVFDRPTPFTLNSLRRTKATKSHLEARVWFKDPPKLTELQHYLLAQVHGGARRLKRFEALLRRKGLLAPGRWLVPASGAPLDTWGNVTRGVYSSILSQLQAQHDVAQRETAKSKKRAARQRTSRYFYGDPGGHGRGIWERSYARGKVRPIFLESKTPRYRSRFAFFDVAQRTVERTFASAFDEAARETLKTAR